MSELEATTQEKLKESDGRRNSYSNYKQTNVDWLGKIPQHWEIHRAEKWFSSTTEKVQPKEMDCNEVKHYSLPNIHEVGDGQIEDPDKIASQKKVLTGKEVLVSKLNPENGMVVSPEINEHIAISSTEFVDLYTENDILRRFAYYFYSSESVKQYLSSEAQSVTLSHKRVNPRVIRRISFPEPPREEQEAIVEFLDRETKRVDELIEKKEELISLLQEREEALITRVTTRGLGGEVSTKEVKNETIAELPENWEESNLGNITTKLTNGYVGPTRDILTEDGIPYIQSTHINDGEIEFGGEFYVSEEWSRNHRTSKLREGDVLLVQTGDVGESAVVREDLDGANCHALIIARPVRDVNSYYLNLFLESRLGKNLLKRTQTGATLKHLNTTRIKDITIPIPPIDEQKEIVEYLESERKRFNSMISQIKQSIERLKEYRTALITEAVTGQIDVRGEV